MRERGSRKPLTSRKRIDEGSRGPRPEAARPSPPERRSAFRIVLEYDGGRYAGWQRQSQSQGVRTVAGTLERVLKEAGLQVLALGGSGRTDAGVHALGQVAHLHLAADQAPRAHELQRLFDEGLPSDVAIRTVQSCDPAFHARHDAVSRSYLYQISRRRTGLAKPYVWWVKQPLDLAKIRTAWTSFEGFFDMRAFADLEQGDEPRCKIGSCEFLEHGSLILLRVTASHFKRSQVRRMVGAAVAVGLGKMKQQELIRDLHHPAEGAALRWSDLAAAASGLFLEHVRYDGDPGPGELRPLTLVL